MKVFSTAEVLIALKPFKSYSDFESVSVPEDNGEQNPDEFYTNKYQEHVACGYGYTLVCIHDKFRKLFTSYLGEHFSYNFINSILKESKYCSYVIKKNLMNLNNEFFDNSTKCWIFLTMVMLTVILRQKIIVISLENIKDLCVYME